MSLFQLLGAPWRAIQRLLCLGDAEERLERLEARDWRRRSILASRRVQLVHLAMEQEFAGMREFQGQWGQAQPLLKELSANLSAAEALLASLQATLDRHQALLEGQEQASAATAALGCRQDLGADGGHGIGHSEQPSLDHPSKEDEKELEEDVLAILEVQERVAEVASHETNEEPRPGIDREAELAETLATERERSLLLERELRAECERAQERLQELEAELQSIGFDRAEDQQLAEQLGDTSGRLEAQLDELQELVQGIDLPLDVVGSPLGDAEPKQQRILELEELNEALQGRLEAGRQSQEQQELRERLRASELRCLELESRHQEELVDFADRSHEHLSAMRSELRTSQAALVELEDERAKVASLALLNERALRSLSAEHEALKAKRSTMAAAAKSLGDIQSVLRRSTKRAEPESITLTQLMGDGGGERVELEAQSSEQVEDQRVE